uniref:NADH-ubiquinone oxidoreductase chain 1 n=1 Tax=Dictyocaulus eckerti TaxID=44604 RepID=K7QMW7_DICEC|nr:NADH dehydrogenase subunit 1 [Dictyocaulus eckerti]AFV32097.1 NADH dehydrogenase subunit 1 [Dictyocaulus eckerti]
MFLIIFSFFMVLVMLVFILQSIAFITLYERHLLGSSQNRLGPNKVFLMGFLQALLDGLKLLKKELFVPIYGSDLSFYLVPGISFLLMIFYWFVIPYFFSFFSFDYSLLFFLGLLGFTVYSMLVSGYVSKSKYGMIGALRAGSQSISYEIAFSIFFCSFMMYLGCFKLCFMNLLLVFFCFSLVFFMVLSELNRAPFDFAEGESELVSGYNVEYGSVSFVLLFLSEYGSLIFFSFLMSVLFFKGSLFLCFFFYFNDFCSKFLSSFSLWFFDKFFLV